MLEESAPTSEKGPERLRQWLRVIVAVFVASLLVGDLAMYSLYQALRSRVEGQDHRIERLQKMVTDMLKANRNGKKIEKIETQVNNIGVQVSDLTTTIKEQDAQEAKAPPPKKKRVR